MALDPNQIASRTQAGAQKITDVATRVALTGIFAVGAACIGMGKQLMQTTGQVLREQPMVKRAADAFNEEPAALPPGQE